MATWLHATAHSRLLSNFLRRNHAIRICGFHARAGIRFDRQGNSFAAGGWGVSSNNDIIVSKRDPAGTLLWQTIYDGPARWHDQAKGVAISPDGLFAYLARNTPGQHQYADGLLLKLDAATGARIWERTFDGGLFIADAWLSIVADDQGNVFVGGWTNGDGPDCLVAKYSPSGDLLWSRTWDGPYTRLRLAASTLSPATARPAAAGRGIVST